jgi:hypothetical protein
MWSFILVSLMMISNNNEVEGSGNGVCLLDIVIRRRYDCHLGGGEDEVVRLVILMRIVLFSHV